MIDLGSFDGVPINPDLTLHGAFDGDTIANLCIGGFKESLGGSLRKCRSCMTRKEQMQSEFFESNFTLRDCQTHLQHTNYRSRAYLARILPFCWKLSMTNIRFV
eukprot:Pompholyxophrys_sp_v1_NODE_9_length_5690_cov_16.428039.p7 type:complete len:104 gc:universal NODE_9_length_5690_cov_16.428039:4852-5163(+)